MVKSCHVRFPDTENMAAYLFKLLDLRLLKHGEDVRASLLSSPLSFIWGLFTRLRKTTQCWIPFEQTIEPIFKSLHQNTIQGIQHYPQNICFSGLCFFLPIVATEGRSWLTMSEWWNLNSQQKCDAEVGFMFGQSYLPRSYNSLRWAPQSLIWPLSCRSDKRWGRLDSSELENWRQEERWGRASDLCCQTLWSIELVVCVWWVQFQSFVHFFFFHGSKHIQN